MDCCQPLAVAQKQPDSVYSNSNHITISDLICKGALLVCVLKFLESPPHHGVKNRHFNEICNIFTSSGRNSHSCHCDKHGSRHASITVISFIYACWLNLVYGQPSSTYTSICTLIVLNFFEFFVKFIEFFFLFIFLAFWKKVSCQIY